MSPSAKSSPREAEEGATPRTPSTSRQRSSSISANQVITSQISESVESSVPPAKSSPKSGEKGKDEVTASTILHFDASFKPEEFEFQFKPLPFAAGADTPLSPARSTSNESLEDKGLSELQIAFGYKPLACQKPSAVGPYIFNHLVFSRILGSLRPDDEYPSPAAICLYMYCLSHKDIKNLFIAYLVTSHACLQTTGELIKKCLSPQYLELLLQKSNNERLNFALQLKENLDKSICQLNQNLQDKMLFSDLLHLSRQSIIMEMQAIKQVCERLPVTIDQINHFFQKLTILLNDSFDIILGMKVFQSIYFVTIDELSNKIKQDETFLTRALNQGRILRNQKTRTLGYPHKEYKSITTGYPEDSMQANFYDDVMRSYNSPRTKILLENYNLANIDLSIEFNNQFHYQFSSLFSEILEYIKLPGQFLLFSNSVTNFMTDEESETGSVIRDAPKENESK